MSDWNTIIRAALATLLGALSMVASLCVEVGDAQESPGEPVVASVSDQPVRAQVSDEAAPPATTCGSDCRSGPVVRSSVSDAIQEVRRAQGSMLEGTLLENLATSPADGEEFSSALQRVARETDITPVSPAPLQPSFSPDLVPGPAAVEGSVLLRQAARELDLRSADQEDLRQFEEADHLRRMATDLRREARRWDERSQLIGPTP